MQQVVCVCQQRAPVDLMDCSRNAMKSPTPASKTNYVKKNLQALKKYPFRRKMSLNGNRLANCNKNDDLL